MVEATHYRANFCRRLKQARLKAGYKTQESFARELGISLGTYASYESRFLMPHHLVPLTCELVNCSSWYLMTGQSWQFAPPILHEESNSIFNGTEPATHNSGSNLIEPMGLCYFDTELRYRWINDWLARLNGLPVAAHYGKTIHEVLKDVAVGAVPYLQSVIDTGKPVIGGEIEASIPNNPGKRLHWRFSYYPDKKENEIVGISCVVQEIVTPADLVPGRLL